MTTDRINQITCDVFENFEDLPNRLSASEQPGTISRSTSAVSLPTTFHSVTDRL